jgi:hypothetical protein
MLQAVVGIKKLDALDRQVRNKLGQLTNSGKHEALNMFKGKKYSCIMLAQCPSRRGDTGGILCVCAYVSISPKF